MSNISSVSLSQAAALERTLNMTAHNLSNANTAGYKAVYPLFDSVAHSVMGRDISFVQDKGVYLDLTGGAVVPTGNSFDIALNGEGWFSYQLDGGKVAYSRHGQLIVGLEGQLKTAQGNTLLDAGGGPITLPQDVGSDVDISAGGVITDRTGAVLATIAVSNINKDLLMRPLGNGMYGLPYDADAPQQADNPEILQGFVEQSNVEAVLEMTRLIDIQRAYENSVKLMNQDDDLTKNAIQRLGRSS